MNKLKFIDKDKSANLQDGFEYFACGIVIHNYTVDGKPKISGKDVVVRYCDPFGFVTTEWRALGDIELSEVSDSDYVHMVICLDDTEALDN